MRVPNHYSLGERLFCVAVAVFAIWYAVDGYLAGEMVMPGRRGGGIGVRDGLALALACVGLLSLAVGAVAVVVDHYDRRDNEKRYEDFMTWTFRIGVVGVVSGVLLQALAS